MKLFAFLFLIGTVAASPAWAAERLKDIDIQGTRRIENETVKTYLDLKKGALMDEEAVDGAVKTLFATGLFSDVKITMDKGVARVVVQENPLVHAIFFEGNKALEEEALHSEVLLKSRAVYTPRKLQNDADRLVEVYKRSGYFAVQVVPQIVPKDQNRVDIVFEIKEGSKTVVKKINILGAKAFSSITLRDKMATKERAWYRFLATTDTYDPDRLKYDLELLRRFYWTQGYVDFDIKNALAELSSDKESFVITIEVSEGARHRFGTSDISVALPEYQDSGKLHKLIDFKAGDFFDTTRVEASVDALTAHFTERGYAFAEVVPDLQKNEAEKTVDIAFQVRESSKVFINRIDIQGNSRTLDKVVRREFRIKEGDAFNSSQLQRSQQRVRDLDYFSRVDLQTQPVPGRDGLTDIIMQVEEKSTGAFNVGIGWSSYDGMLFETGIVERNILGTGNIASINAMFSERETQYTMGLTNPYFMGRNLLAGIDVFQTTYDNEDESSYSYETVGATLRFGWNYTDRFRQSARYTVRQDDINDVESDASIYIKDQQGKRTVSLLGQELVYDRRDSKISPTQGYYLSWGADVAGLGGDAKYARTSLTGIRYFPVAEDVIFSVRGDAGHIWGLGGQDIRVNDRYFLGDISLRGFEYGGVGARDKTTDDALGGNWYATASAELTFPIGLPKEVGIKGKVFSDIGVIGKPDNFDSAQIDYSSQPRAAVGTGILWQSPMGMINFDFSYPIVKNSRDKTRVFRLNFGKGF